eukprot:13878240-Alexandrium_andersonii.AAC.1
MKRLERHHNCPRLPIAGRANLKRASSDDWAVFDCVRRVVDPAGRSIRKYILSDRRSPICFILELRSARCAF